MDERGVEWVERPTGESLRLGPERAEVVHHRGATLAVAENVDASRPVVEVQAEVIEDAVHERDPEHPPAAAAFSLGPVVTREDTAKRTH